MREGVSQWLTPKVNLEQSTGSGWEQIPAENSICKTRDAQKTLSGLRGSTWSRYISGASCQSSLVEKHKWRKLIPRTLIKLFHLLSLEKQTLLSRKGVNPTPPQSRVERVPLSCVPTHGLLHPLKKWCILFWSSDNLHNPGQVFSLLCLSPFPYEVGK